MSKSAEPSRKRQRVERRRRQPTEAFTSRQTMMTRSRTRSTMHQPSSLTQTAVIEPEESYASEDSASSNEMSGGTLEVDKASYTNGKKRVEGALHQDNAELAARHICSLESDQDIIAKLGYMFSDPCVLAHSFPQTDQERVDNCPVDILDVRKAYSHISQRASKKVLDELRQLSIEVIAMMNADPCSEHDDLVNAVLILLVDPRITEYVQDDGVPVFPELCSVILGQPPAQRTALMRYFATGCGAMAGSDTSTNATDEAAGTQPWADVHAKLPVTDEVMNSNPDERASFTWFVGIFQLYISQEMEKAAQRAAQTSTPSEGTTQKVSLHAVGGSSLGLAAQCLALANGHNNANAVVPYSVFYNAAVNEHMDIKEEVPRFRMPDGVSFCSYPFLLSPTTKSEIIRIESVILMRTELQDSFFRAMFSGVTCPYLVLEVRRDSLVRDTLYQLDLKLNQDLRKQLKVRFVGEEGVDEGGVQKEFFQLIVRDVFSPKYGIFRASESSLFHWFRPQAELSQDTLEEIRLTGQLIGLAVYNAVILDIHLPPAIYKKLLGVPVIRDDLRQVDPALYHGLTQLLHLSSDELAFLERTFVAEYDDLGELCTHELIPGGAQTQLTVDNRELFIDSYVDFVFNTSCKRQFSEFKSGFDQICGASYVRFMRPQELELLVCGCSDLDFAALERSTIYDGGYTKSTEVIQNFWHIVRLFSDDLKRKLLFFATSSDRVPIGGLSKLHFVIAKNGGDSDRLPTSHTCFNVLLLPEYANVEKLRERLLTAIHNAEGFGMI
ncbi:HECT-domain-containing protein [Coemansia reversa NRRL 1564]|uniref:HECT-type E3 ubiquitin transferase n=1 Tax=Coemansia reversa (strain ATCC 12441 / NRRL 1564) TaxID=763665 RepID=A0A2G5BC55_COERN|nr:HECT-domain-containing protein [Coemansia reversa NRRL 1564]|eukprot:PIA16590.1 HECT-domain-containing protein [Coemansia reversa NRRL 1564]